MIRIDYTYVSYFLFYPERGILAIYNSIAYVTEDTVLICPQNKSNALLVLYPSSEDTSIYELLYTSYSLIDPPAVDNEYGYQIGLFEELTHLSTEWFYQTYLDPLATDCFPTDRDIWYNPND